MSQAARKKIINQIQPSCTSGKHKVWTLLIMSICMSIHAAVIKFLKCYPKIDCNQNTISSLVSWKHFFFLCFIQDPGLELGRNIPWQAITGNAMLNDIWDETTQAWLPLHCIIPRSRREWCTLLDVDEIPALAESPESTKIYAESTTLPS